jgi:riboflavin kinase/FMN adenylyltransferase
VYVVQVFDVSAEIPIHLSGGVAHIGARPTVSKERTIEVHLLDFSDDLYDRVLRIDLLFPLRPVQKFESLSELKTQIAVDVEAARQRLALSVKSSTETAGLT